MQVDGHVRSALWPFARFERGGGVAEFGEFHERGRVLCDRVAVRGRVVLAVAQGGRLHAARRATRQAQAPMPDIFSVSLSHKSERGFRTTRRPTRSETRPSREKTTNLEAYVSLKGVFETSGVFFFFFSRDSPRLFEGARRPVESRRMKFSCVCLARARGSAPAEETLDEVRGRVVVEVEGQVRDLCRGIELKGYYGDPFCKGLRGLRFASKRDAVFL